MMCQQIVLRDESAGEWLAAECVVPTMPIVIAQLAVKPHRFSTDRTRVNRGAGPRGSSMGDASCSD